MNKKHILMRILAVITVFTLLIGGTGCELKDKISEALDSKSFGIGGIVGEENNYFTQTEMPKLKAKKIDYYYSSDMEYNCFLVCIDGKYGTLNDDGLTIVDPIFEKPNFSIILYSEDTNYSNEKLRYVLWCDNGDGSIMVFDEGGGLTSCQLVPFGLEDGSDIYWMSGKPVLVPWDSELKILECSYSRYYEDLTSQFKYMGYMNFPRNREPSVIPIREVTSFKDTNYMGADEVTPVYKSEKCGLFNFDTNKMNTDFIYDECIGPVKGIFAVRKGSRWGYVTEDGKMLTDYVYDVADVKLDEYDSDYNKNEMFLPLNGYIVTKKDGKYGIIDINGKSIVENTCDYISQVSSNGTFFALKDGMWIRCVMK